MKTKNGLEEKLSPEEIFVQVLKDDGSPNKVHTCAECGQKYHRVLGGNNNMLCNTCCKKLKIPATSVCAECKSPYLIIPKINNTVHCKECCKKNGDKTSVELGEVKDLEQIDDKLPEPKAPAPADNSPLKMTKTATDVIFE